MPTPCPKCARPNGSHRNQCLYCGEALEHAASAEPRVVDETAIEEAVFAALSGAMAVGDLENVLPDASDDSWTGNSENPPTERDCALSPGVPVADPIQDLPVSPIAGQLLAEVQLESTMEAERLPIGRRPFVLVLDGCADPSLAPQIAEHARIDLVTARMVATSDWDRPLLWHAQREVLDGIAARLTDEMGLGASVLESARLSETASVHAVLGATESGGFHVTPKPVWMGRPIGDEEGEALSQQEIRLVVPGQIAIRRFQDVRRGKWARKKGTTVRREIGERRVVLMDLHSPSHILRVVIGVTDFSGFPGYHEGSGPLSMRGLEEALPVQFPSAHIEGKRVCHPQTARAMLDSDTQWAQFELTGWSAWEEHTRICRVHRGMF